MRIRTGHAGRALARGVAAIVAGACLSGCSFEVDVGNVLEGIAEQAGEDLDVNLGVGESCLPSWVNHPEESAGNQGFATPDHTVCVSAWPDISRATDVTQQLPTLGTGTEIAAAANQLLVLMAPELPPAAAGLLRDGVRLDELREQLELEDISFTAYGDEARLLLVLTAIDQDQDGMQVVMGAFCEGTC